MLLINYWNGLTKNLSRIIDSLPHYPLLPSFDSDNDSDIEGENQIQKFSLGDKLQNWSRGGRKRCSYCQRKDCYKKVKFSENFSKLFPEADEIFDNQKIDGNLSEITILKQCSKN